jgi:hypothetical protein
MIGAIRLIVAPIRRIAASRLFQFAVVVTIIVLLDRYSFDYPELRPVTDGLHALVTATVQFCSNIFRVGILTDPVLQAGLTIAYVYVICLFMFFVLRHVVRKIIDFIGWSNFLWLRSTIAHERGITAYEAWLPLERIRPDDCPQEQWEQEYAWPADNKPPYPPWPKRMLSAAFSYVIVLGGAAVLLQYFTPFPVLSWIKQLI